MASRPDEGALAQHRAGGVTALPAAAGSKRVPGAAAKASADAAAKRARAVAAVAGAGPNGEGVQQPEAQAVPQPGEETEADAAHAEDEFEEYPPMPADDAPAPQVEDRQVSSSMSSKNLAWLGVSIPEAQRDATEFEHTEMALQILLLEMTDEARPDGALDVPEKPLRVDKSAGKQGPHFYAFDKLSTIKIILGETEGKLYVDIGEDEFEFKMFHARETRDTSAQTLFAAGGFWMELYTKKSEMIKTKEMGARLVKDQLNIMVSKSKWPRADGAPDRSRLLLQASLYPHEKASEKRLPIQVYIHHHDIDHPFNYRLQADAFPGLCGYCHQPKDTNECVCDKNKSIKNYEKKAREGGKLKANERAQRNKHLAQKGADKTSTMAAKLARIRERRAATRVPPVGARPADGAASSSAAGALVPIEGADLR